MEQEKQNKKLIENKNTLEVKKYLNFSNNFNETSEADLEDVVTQAPNPSHAPKPSKDFKSHNYAPSVIYDKPEFNSETHGYLPPKSMRDVGKKTLVSNNRILKYLWFVCTRLVCDSGNIGARFG